MIEIPVHPKYSENSERCTGDDSPCVVCGKPVKRWRKMVRVVNGGNYIGTDADAAIDPMADLGYHPIGVDCLRQHPDIKPYAVEVEAQS